MQSFSLLLLACPTIVFGTFSIQQSYQLQPPPPPQLQTSFATQYPAPSLPSYVPPPAPAPPTFIFQQPMQLVSPSFVPSQPLYKPSQTVYKPPQAPYKPPQSFVHPSPSLFENPPSYLPSAISQQQYANAPQNYPQPLEPYPAQPTYQAAQMPPAYVQSRCWRSVEGFPCCSKELESFMLETMNDERNIMKWKGCNMQMAVNDLQKSAQSRFNISFEAVVAQSQMENKSRFRDDLMCKLRTRDGKIALLYATAEQYSLEGADYHPLSSEELQQLNLPEDMNEIRTTDDI
ncbi:hypothetical protein RB195_014792 [Necator americanus]|uniref:Ground-like domain-containing protein n=1 Tax=Necator americanus TaxID=51031 RepID=A0ABR1E1P0_NECAM